MIKTEQKSILKDSNLTTTNSKKCLKNSTESKKSSQSRSWSKKADDTALTPPHASKLDRMKKEAMEARQIQINHFVSSGELKNGFDETQRADLNEEEKTTNKSPILYPDETFKDSSIQPVSSNPIPGEIKQEVGDHGDYLVKYPTVSIFLEGAEVLLNVLILVFVIVAFRFDKVGIWFVLVDLITCLSLTIFVLMGHYKNLGISKKEVGNHTIRYYVKEKFKCLYFNFTFWRIFFYFVSFLTFIYYSICGYIPIRLHYPGYCHDTVIIQGFSVAASVVSFLIMFIPIVHLYFMKKNIFGIQVFRKHN